MYGILLPALLAAANPAPAVHGRYVEARTCDVFTGACFANADTGLTGKNGCAAERRGAGSASGFTFGSGAEGRTAAAIESLEVLSKTAVERACLPAFVFDAVVTFAASSPCGMAHSISSVARTIHHLSLASGLASPAPLAVSSLYWPKVQQTLVLRSHFA